jgi:hypothetical protein
VQKIYDIRKTVDPYVDYWPELEQYATEIGLNHKNLDFYIDLANKCYEKHKGKDPVKSNDSDKIKDPVKSNDPDKSKDPVKGKEGDNIVLTGNSTIGIIGIIVFILVVILFAVLHYLNVVNNVTKTFQLFQ